MLVSHRYRFIHAKTRKTAGTSVESYFEPFCMQRGEWRERHFREMYASPAGIIGYRGSPGRARSARWWNHMPAALIRERLGESIWESYFKFCVVRNPYEKAISAYYHHKQLEPEWPARGCAVWSDDDPGRFEEWLELGRPPDDRHIFCIDGRFALDHVIRYESLLGDLERVCERLCVPWEPARLPAFKAGVRPREATAERLYTPRARELAAAAYQFELEYFGYDFPAAVRSMTSASSRPNTRRKSRRAVSR